MTLSHPRPARGLALAAAISALAAPSASAAPAEQLFPRAEDESASRSSSAPPSPSSIAASAAEEYNDLRSPDGTTTVPVRVVKVQADAGFDWGDAGIGAAGMLALFSIAAGSALLLTSRRRRHGIA
jgi:glucose/arabinose dehydrogenase